MVKRWTYLLQASSNVMALVSTVNLRLMRNLPETIQLQNSNVCLGDCICQGCFIHADRLMRDQPHMPQKNRCRCRRVPSEWLRSCSVAGQNRVCLPLG